jgi:hypothetical protein
MRRISPLFVTVVIGLTIRCSTRRTGRMSPSLGPDESAGERQLGLI